MKGDDLSRFDPPGAHEVYRAVIGPEHEVVTKELELLNRLADEVEAHMPPGLSGRDREIRAQGIVNADPALTELAAELVELSKGREKPALWELIAEAEDPDEDD